MSPALKVQNLSHWTTREVPLSGYDCFFFVVVFIKKIEKASDIDITRGQKECPLTSVSNGVI